MGMRYTAQSSLTGLVSSRLSGMSEDKVVRQVVFSHNMMMTLTSAHINQAAHAIFTILDEFCGKKACLLGSAATFGHGTSRVPNVMIILRNAELSPDTLVGH